MTWIESETGELVNLENIRWIGLCDKKMDVRAYFGNLDATFGSEDYPFILLFEGAEPGDGEGWLEDLREKLL